MENLNNFQLLEYAAWGISAVLGLWMLFDMIRTNAKYSESTLISSSSCRPTIIRSRVTGPSMWMLASSCSARSTDNARPVPPSITKHNRACSRQIVRVRLAVT